MSRHVANLTNFSILRVLLSILHDENFYAHITYHTVLLFIVQYFVKCPRWLHLLHNADGQFLAVCAALPQPLHDSVILDDLLHVNGLCPLSLHFQHNSYSAIVGHCVTSCPIFWQYWQWLFGIVVNLHEWPSVLHNLEINFITCSVILQWYDTCSLLLQ